jgi:WXG100 family type VII secretion target
VNAYEVDVDELRAVVAAMTAQSATLRGLAGEVDDASASLSSEWSGVARDAHATAHTGWAGEFVQLREALTALHTLGGAAADNYATAVETNIAMWEQVR